MTDTPMFYREINPSPEIAHLVLSFWEFTAEFEHPEPIIHEVFPDACVSLFYHRNVNVGTNRLFIKDLSLETIKTEIFSGDIIWGMRFSPAACAQILRINPSELKSQPLTESRNFTHLTAGLMEKFTFAQNFEEACQIYGSVIESLQIIPAETDGKIVEALRIMAENHGEVKISAVADMVNLSLRQLERRFKKNAGLSPKQFARARRIRATAISLVEEDKMNWASRAAEMGFTDQAHLTREFSLLTGRSPNSFAEKVSRIEHGKLVK